jgi:hypothetical protein
MALQKKKALATLERLQVEEEIPTQKSKVEKDRSVKNFIPEKSNEITQ